MARASSDIPRRLPRGSHGLDRDVVTASQRTRLLEAVGRAVAERGYGAATIDDVVRGAGVSKKTFYEHFADKQDCFLAAYEAASEELRDRYAELMRERRVDGQPRLPVEVFHAVVAAVDDVVVRHIREHGAEDLPALEPVLLYLQTALLAGPDAAAEAARAE